MPIIQPTESEMSKIAATLMLASAWAATSYAASDVSPRFDGVYSGTLAPLAWMSQRTCAEIALRVEVRNGFFARGALLVPSVNGFVTDEGFVTGRLHRQDSKTLAFEGRIVEGELSAGAIDEEAGCYWVATLTATH